MSKRVIGRFLFKNRMATVRYDNVWDDHIVSYNENGVNMVEADSHHYDDREDAINTAQNWASRN